MNIEKRPSGSYRIRQMVNGKKYTVAVDHKPSNKEALMLITNLVANDDSVISSNMPLRKACNAYIESKSNVLSPSSIRGYMSIIRQISDKLLDTPIDIITKPMVQSEVNRYSADHSPKSTKNFSGFIISVLSFYGNEITKITLPQSEKKAVYIPTEEEVHAIFKAVKGTRFEAAILLSGMGLRRSEIAALELSDLSDDDILTINKAKVQDKDHNWIIKTTKTTESTRCIKIDHYIAELIRSQGYVYEGHPELIYRKLIEVQKELGIPHFPLHKMRHFFVSYAHLLGFPDKQIQSITGHKSTKTLNEIYKQPMGVDKAKEEMAVAIGKLI